MINMHQILENTCHSYANQYKFNQQVQSKMFTNQSEGSPLDFPIQLKG